MGSKVTEYSLVHDSESFFAEKDELFPIDNTQRSWTRYQQTHIVVLILIVSVALNVGAHFQLRQQKALAAEASRSRFGKMRQLSLCTIADNFFSGPAS